MKNKLFHFRLFELENVNAMLLRNQGRPLVGIIARLFPPMGVRLTKMRIAEVKAFLLQINLIAKRQGIRGAVMYLKVSGVAVQQAIAGHVLKDLTSLGPRVARDKKGLPTLLPLRWRKEIHAGNTSSMILTLTVISLFRVLTFPAQAKLTTITSPFKGRMDMITKFIERFKVPGAKPGTTLVGLYTSMISRPLSRRGMDAFDWVKGRTAPFPILTSSPTSVSNDDEISTSPTSIWRAMYSFVQRNVLETGTLVPMEGTLYHALHVILRLGDAIPKTLTIPYRWSTFTFQYRMGFMNYATGSMAKWAEELGNQIFATGIRFSSWEKGPSRNTSKPWFLGKLGFKDEAAGKVRVFAMVDPWSQWALRPIHLLLFKLLRAIPMDGTFDQLKPITRLLKRRPKILDSLDLSAATDRLPILLQEWIIASLFNPAVGKAWSTLLVGRDYKVPKRDGQIKPLPKMVKYDVGQPMGALSSWAMLAITHHFIVQIAAWQAGVTRYGRWFEDYALLGDDLTLGNRAVSLRYQKIMIQYLGVEIGLAKSILSDRGIGLEFAKKTFYKGVNVSPRPFKELAGALLSPAALASYAARYNLTDAQLFKVAGFGYKVLGGLNRPLSKQNTSVRFTLITLHLPQSTADIKKAYESMRTWFKTHDLVEWFYEFISSEAVALSNRLNSMERTTRLIFASYQPSYFKSVLDAEVWNKLDKTVQLQIRQILSELTWASTFDYTYRMRSSLSYISRNVRRIIGLKEQALALYRDHGLFVGQVNDASISYDLYYIFLQNMQEASKWSQDSLNLTRPLVREGFKTPQIAKFYNSFNGFLRKLIGKSKRT